MEGIKLDLLEILSSFESNLDELIEASAELGRVGYSDDLWFKVRKLRERHLIYAKKLKEVMKSYGKSVQINYS